MHTSALAIGDVLLNKSSGLRRTVTQINDDTFCVDIEGQDIAYDWWMLHQFWIRLAK